MTYIQSEEVTSFSGEYLIADITGRSVLILSLFAVYGSDFIKEDAIDENGLANFLSASKEIYEEVFRRWTNNFDNLNIPVNAWRGSDRF